MGEKTEEASPKKLNDARKKGQVAKSADFPAAFTFFTSILLTLGLGTYIFSITGSLMYETFVAVRNHRDLLPIIMGTARYCIDAIAMVSLPILGAVAAVGVIVNMIIIGPLFAPEAIKFDLKRLNPIDGIKQKFKLKVLFELLKSLAKIIGAAFIVYVTIKDDLSKIVASIILPVEGIAAMIADFLRSVAIRVGIFFLVVAIVDLLYQKRTFAKEMMMDKHEVKQEYKEMEGNPEIKGKRQELAREIAYDEGPAGVANSQAVISNPTHIAVVIRYHAKKTPVPLIVTMGKDKKAEEILERANLHNVPIMRNPELARLIFKSGRAGKSIPREAFAAVAEVLVWVSNIEKEEKKNEKVI